ncbi:MAG: DUF5131 family protein [bacterium]|nr:DUF5131 family protein [bacterium]
MNKTKIDWCDATWNPVTGCLHGCTYCYAAAIAHRFGNDHRLYECRTEEYRRSGRIYILDKPMKNYEGKDVVYPFEFAPTYHRYRLNELESKFKNGTNIFVCSMADLFGEWVPDKVISEIFEACINTPRHNYLFLTKNPKRYEDLMRIGKLPKRDNFWYGTTVTAQENKFFVNGEYNTFVSIEPIQGAFPRAYEVETDEKHIWGLKRTNWIIIGAETGTYRKKVIPKSEWITNIVMDAMTYGLPVFLKDSVEEIVGKGKMLREMPERLRVHEMSETNKKRFRGRCKMCGKESELKEMIAVLKRNKRGESAKQWFYLCDDCFMLTDKLVSDGDIEIRRRNE